MNNESGKTKWYYEPWVVILLIFVALGPFGLPLVYKSPKFNRTSQVIVTLLTVLYTWLLVDATMKGIELVIKTFEDFKTTLREARV